MVTFCSTLWHAAFPRWGTIGGERRRGKTRERLAHRDLVLRRRAAEEIRQEHGAPNHIVGYNC
jgi:hypothetical protein